MGKRKLADEEIKQPDIPIPDLPKNFLLMQVKSGTKIRNVLGYALKEFPNKECIVWTAAGYGVGKAISCAELFKRKHEGLHQVTKLRYIESKKSQEESKTADQKPHKVPEIHILLTKHIKDNTQPGYQAPGDQGEFLERRVQSKDPENIVETGERSNVTSIDTEEFAAMGLRTGTKRPKKNQHTNPPSKKTKKKAIDTGQ